MPFLLALGALALAASAVMAPEGPRQTTGAATWSRAPLQPTRLGLLPLGAIRPRGWLQRQLRIQADGLTGHLDEFWPAVGTGESWERGSSST